MWRRALISMTAMLGFSALFVGLVMLTLGSIVDMAVAPAGPDEGNETVEAAKASEGESKGGSVDAKGPDKPGERS